MCMERTVCELFAGVGGFRCGLNSIKSKDFKLSSETWRTVWFNQWEPGKKKQWAHDCYVKHFGTALDLNGDDTTNMDIASVDKAAIPDHNLLVGGFPCQDYSVARSLNGEKGIEGKKGVLWWSIWDILKAKSPPFVLLENVDRLLLSPSKQRGRDFGIILACLAAEGYAAEWRVVNAAEYGEVQRRRRTFIFAYKKETHFAQSLGLRKDVLSVSGILGKKGFFAKVFPVNDIAPAQVLPAELPGDIADVSDSFSFEFANSGIMFDGSVYTVRTQPEGSPSETLGDIIEKDEVDKKYFIPGKRLYFTDPASDHSDETEEELPAESRRTWQYIKGAKRKYRTAANGHRYVYSEGAVPMIDEWDKPARTMLTSEGSFNRSTHIVRDYASHKIRILTPREAERIQGFPDDWTDTGMPEKFRYFCMGNALVVPLIARMGSSIKKIFRAEPRAKPRA
ncbi:MAG: DNA (cytosine-5-)-methyltransferase [Treponema sp.]|nr:DNA (cytosine-5-)-methyltransferase [Treponema sp.]MBQ7167980.1 DNA (cytosine-5-)-methyltransferase [Treponema sp.]